MTKLNICITFKILMHYLDKELSTYIYEIDRFPEYT